MTLFSLYEGKLIRLTDDQGNTFTGVADTFPVGIPEKLTARSAPAER